MDQIDEVIKDAEKTIKDAEDLLKELDETERERQKEHKLKMERMPKKMHKKTVERIILNDDDNGEELPDIVSYEEFSFLMSLYGSTSPLKRLEKRIHEQLHELQQAYKRKTLENELNNLGIIITNTRIEPKILNIGKYKKIATALATFPQRFPMPTVLVINKYIIKDLDNSNKEFYELRLDKGDFEYIAIALKPQEMLEQSIHNYKFFESIKESDIFKESSHCAFNPSGYWTKELCQEYHHPPKGFYHEIRNQEGTEEPCRSLITEATLKSSVQKIHQRLTKKGIPSWKIKAGKTAYLKVILGSIEVD